MRVQSASPEQQCRHGGVLPVCSTCPLLLQRCQYRKWPGLRAIGPVALSALPGQSTAVGDADQLGGHALPRIPKPVMVTACRGCQKGFPTASSEGDISVRGGSLHCLHMVRKGSSLLEANYRLDLGPTTHMA